MSFSRYLSNAGFVFSKENKLRVLSSLVTNCFLRQLLRVKKLVFGIHHPIVHLYTVCWNEEKILPFFFDHYDSIVDHYYVFDHHSTDSSKSLIRSNDKASLLEYNADGIDDKALIELKNTVWKQSRGKADYVVVCDSDEFLFHHDLTGLLKSSTASVFHPIGFNMVSDSFPHPGSQLIKEVCDGVQDDAYSKCVLFDPYKIVEINYDPGCHTSHPQGIVSFFEGSDLMLLHYKNLGLDYLLSRLHQYKDRLSETNKRNGFAIHYQYSEDKVKSDFQDIRSHSSKIV